jgi:hypothetical protein
MVFQLSPVTVPLSTFALEGLLYLPFDILIPSYDYIRVISYVSLPLSPLFFEDFPEKRLF